MCCWEFVCMTAKQKERLWLAMGPVWKEWSHRVINLNKKRKDLNTTEVQHSFRKYVLCSLWHASSCQMGNLTEKKLVTRKSFRLTKNNYQQPCSHLKWTVCSFSQSQHVKSIRDVRVDRGGAKNKRLVLSGRHQGFWYTTSKPTSIVQAWDENSHIYIYNVCESIFVVLLWFY